MAIGDAVCQRAGTRDEDVDGTTRTREDASTTTTTTTTTRAMRRAVRTNASRARESWASTTTSVLGFEHDATRTARFFAVGATVHGPFFHYAFKELERRVGGGTCARTVVKKVAIGHTMLFPSYTVLFFVAMAYLEGWEAPATRAREQLEEKFVDTILAGTMFWPFANAVNFAYVPTKWRILALNVAGVAWNAYMSHVVNANSAPFDRGADGAIVGASAREKAR